jgi:hypothetical protein
VGRGRSLRRHAGVALSAGRADAHLAVGLRLVWPRPAAVGASVAGLPLANRTSHAPPPAPRLPHRLSLRRAVVHGQLLLGSRHHAALRRYAAHGTDTAAHRLQHGSGALLRPLRLGSRACPPSHKQHATGVGLRSGSLGRAGVGRIPHHLRPLGSTRLLAGGQHPGESACALDRRLRHQFCAGRRQCAPDRRAAAGVSPAYRTQGPDNFTCDLACCL